MSPCIEFVCHSLAKNSDGGICAIVRVGIRHPCDYGIQNIFYNPKMPRNVYLGAIISHISLNESSYSRSSNPDGVFTEPIPMHF